MKSPVRRLSWLDRLELRFCSSRTVDGLWIGAFEGDAPALLERVELALALIRDHDARRYRTIRRCLSRIWVRLLPGPGASFSAAARACQLDTRYVADPAVTLEDLATSIVHEAAHARIDRWIPYREDLRQRIEVVCRGQELAFARRLPAGGAIAERTEQWLASPQPADFWSDAAFHDRWLEGSLENLRHAGLPEWFLRGLRRFHAFAFALRQALRRLVIPGARRP